MATMKCRGRLAFLFLLCAFILAGYVFVPLVDNKEANVVVNDNDNNNDNNVKWSVRNVHQQQPQKDNNTTDFDVDNDDDDESEDAIPVAVANKPRRYGYRPRFVPPPPPETFGERFAADDFIQYEIEVPAALREEMWPRRFKKKHQHRTSSNNGVSGVTGEPRLYLDTLGFLGKQLFQYAAFLGLAASSHRAPYLSPRSLLWTVFANLTVERGYDSKAKIYIEDGAGRYTPALLAATARTHDAAAVCCYLQSWRYFQDSLPNVRSQLRNFQQPIALEANAQRSNAVAAFVRSAGAVKTARQRKLLAAAGRLSSRGTPVVVDGKRLTFRLIGVHVRRAGLASKRLRRNGFRAAPVEFLHLAMQYFRNKFSNALFLVVSDDIPWCKANMTRPGHDPKFATDNITYSGEDVVFMSGTNAAAVDLAILAGCDDVVMTGGAFGWWGGFLAGGEVLYWDRFWKKGSDVDKAYRAGDYYFPSWRALGDDHRFGKPQKVFGA